MIANAMVLDSLYYYRMGYLNLPQNGRGHDLGPYSTPTIRVDRGPTAQSGVQVDLFRAWGLGRRG